MRAQLTWCHPLLSLVPAAPVVSLLLAVVVLGELWDQQQTAVWGVLVVGLRLRQLVVVGLLHLELMPLLVLVLWLLLVKRGGEGMQTKRQKVHPASAETQAWVEQARGACEDDLVHAFWGALAPVAVAVCSKKDRGRKHLSV